jgi:DNA topoisomerase IA
MQLHDPDKKIRTLNDVAGVWEKILGKNIDKNIPLELDVRKFKKEMEITKSSSEAKKKYPPPPFITASLQKEAAGKLKFSTKKTMSLAQKLYEGVFA